jgi:hypothetical protein
MVLRGMNKGTLEGANKEGFDDNLWYTRPWSKRDDERVD